jgi:hypothetical protein
MFDKKLRAYLIASVLALILIVSGCASFPPKRATEPPLPTDTPLLPLSAPTSTPTLPPPPSPTDTPTLVVVTSTPEPTNDAEPTDTPEPSPPTATPESSMSTPTPTPTSTSVPQSTELLINGNFEEGFAENGVAIGWSGFSNGQAGFGWHDDTWSPVVWQGEHSQLLYIMDPSQNDRYIGIYQTVSVAPAETYTLTLHGLVRANTPAEDYGHRLYWGVDYNGGADWQAVENWAELAWDQQPEVADSFIFNSYTTVITSTSQSLTLFLRGHTKWVRYGQADFNLDGLSLIGVPGAEAGAPGMPVTGRGEIEWVPIAALIILLLILFREGWRGIDRWRERT